MADENKYIDAFRQALSTYENLNLSDKALVQLQNNYVDYYRNRITVSREYLQMNAEVLSRVKSGERDKELANQLMEKTREFHSMGQLLIPLTRDTSAVCSDEWQLITSENPIVERFKLGIKKSGSK